MNYFQLLKEEPIFLLLDEQLWVPYTPDLLWIPMGQRYSDIGLLDVSGVSGGNRSAACPAKDFPLPADAEASTVFRQSGNICQ